MWGTTPTIPAATVRAVNRLTARWAHATATGTVTATTGAPDAVAPATPELDAPTGTVLSAAGLWPLLGFLADGAAGAARAELEEALGLRAEEAAGAARGLLAALSAIPGSTAAVGLWARHDLKVREEWRAGLPETAFGRLGGEGPEADQRRLDAWAAEHTGGLIPTMPVTVREDTELVLAVAQALRTRWIRPFRPGLLSPETGPWAGRELVGLHRRTALLDRVGVAEAPFGPLTVLRVLGNTGVDVHLLLGPEEADGGAVLSAGIELLSGARKAVPGDLLPLGTPGPGLRVGLRLSETREPSLDVSTSPFSLTSDHDLRAHARLLGLTAACVPDPAPLPGVSEEPLVVEGAQQTAVARFHARGFEAASVSAMAAAGGLPRMPYRVRSVELDIDRPFGFLAVHRTSRLVLSAGWVAEPVPYDESDLADLYDDDDEDEGWGG
ncbi:serpin family protein [Streptomyces sp. NPDC056264]|uniref:serpin family protein n=1 Tax=Streptomyces sp. NPDC056264 TaxID=3345767 RepID=UPI003AADF78C